MKESNNNGHILITPEVLDKETAVSAKIKKLQAKIFGIRTTKFDVSNIRKVFVPYCYFLYHFEIIRKTFINRSGKFDRKGDLAMVFDCNEVHAVQYDLSENEKIRFTELEKSEIVGDILPKQCTDAEIDEKVVWKIQNKVLRPLYATTGELTLLERKMFYRPAYELTVMYSDVSNLRYAYMDDYGTESEHILGLKVRMGSNF